jgi:rhomboid protease GluP
MWKGKSEKVEKSARNSMLCPNCRSLISRDEERCPHCGLRNPGSRWKGLFARQGSLLAADRLITNIIWLNAGMFILSILISPGSIGLSTNPLSFLSPGSNSLLILGATGTIPIDRFHRWWTLLSASWLHGSILHILFNMIAFRQIGFFVIREYGPYRMFTIYTLSGAGGFLVSYFAGVPFTIGASAAVCGLIGAALYYGKSRGGQYGQAVYQQVGGWAISIFVFGFLVPGINNWAHGGGLLCGVLAGFLLGYQERNQESHYHRLIAAICALSTLGALLAGVLSLL